MAKQKPYFESHEEIARYLGLSLPDFLEMVKVGKWGCNPKPIDPRMVYFREDVDKWMAQGRPVQNHRLTATGA